MYTVDCRLKLVKKSIGDGPRAPKCLLMEIRGIYGVYKGSIRGQRSNFRISKILICIVISRLKLDEKLIGDVPKGSKCLLWGIRGL
jgi:hypothetical protein